LACILQNEQCGGQQGSRRLIAVPKVFRLLILQAGLLILSLLFIDAAAYWLLPPSIARAFPLYRLDRSAEIADIIYRRAHPNRPAYYLAHPDRGFDIAPNSSAFYVTEAQRYRVTSNELGCFDKPWAQQTRTYLYLAGDSFTWGHAPLEQTFGYLLESKIGVPIAKCGVGHTGQAHQFSKFLEVSAKIGHLPKQVVVGYYINDFLNDNAHPHTTMVDGLLVDTVDLDEQDRPVHLNPQEALLRAEYWRRASEERDDQTLHQNPASRFLRRYSITANLGNKAYRSLGRQAAWPRDRAGRNLYDRPEPRCVPHILPFSENGVFEAHAKVLRRWAAHAAANGYVLTFVLIPPKECHDNVELYGKLQAFLKSLGVQVIDLATEFKTRGLSSEQIYFTRDIHFTLSGHKAVAEILAAKLHAD